MDRRRNFLKQMLGLGCGSLTLTPFLSSVTNLQAINALALNNSTVMATSNSSYKALVCIMQSGGNDSYNMLVPNEDDSYLNYKSLRGSLAINQEELLNITPSNLNVEYGLHPSLTNLQSMFNAGNASFVANVGTLVEPIANASQLENRSLPIGLYSHSDQALHWQTSFPQSRTQLGWGGKLIDLLSSSPNIPYSSHISLSGNNTFQRGVNLQGFTVDPAATYGSKNITEGANGVPFLRRISTVNSLMEANYTNILEKSYANTISNSVEYSDGFNSSIQNISETDSSLIEASGFSNTNLSAQLKMVAKTIAARGELGACRQTFYVVQSGYDTHDDMKNRHEKLMMDLDEALGSFNTALNGLGVNNDVTTFTISDFARGLTSNGDGTDHGWGGHALVMGGDVQGGKVLGDYPDLNNTDIRLSGGRFIPTTSCDEYFADLALWFGASASDLDTILPNISSFDYNINQGLGLFS